MLGDEMDTDTNELYNGIEQLEAQLCQPLTTLRADISNRALQEYQSTGTTPRNTLFRYPTKLPRTEALGNAIPMIGDDALRKPRGLRKADPNIAENQTGSSSDPRATPMSMSAKHMILSSERIIPSSRHARSKGIVVDGRENLPVAFSQNASRNGN